MVPTAIACWDLQPITVEFGFLGKVLVRKQMHRRILIRPSFFLFACYSALCCRSNIAPVVPNALTGIGGRSAA